MNTGTIPQEICSEFCKGPGTTVVWHIKGWDNNMEEDFKLLCDNSSCIVDVGLGGTDGTFPGVGVIEARLRFYFRRAHKYVDCEGEPDYDDVASECLDLYADEIFNKDNKILRYDIKVDFLDDGNLDPEDYKPTDMSRAKFDYNDRNKTIKSWASDTTIKLEKCAWPGSSPAKLPRPSDLRLKISVTPIYIYSLEVNSANDDKPQKPEGDLESSMFHSLKSMFSAEENYSDLNLETKDNITLSAHKFILAARSPVLRDLIEDHAKENDWNGTIKLPDVNAKAMTVILHWIYCGELHESVGNCVDEALEAAARFRLTELIKMLDRKLLLSCDKENMFFLYQVAQRNGLVRAIEDISKFIKGNI